MEVWHSYVSFIEDICFNFKIKEKYLQSSWHGIVVLCEVNIIE